MSFDEVFISITADNKTISGIFFFLYYLKSRNTNHQLLTKPIDFYSLSMLRDLIFHFQEHCFTIPQIKNCLDELGLKFCGFVNEDTISIFRKYFGKKSDIYDLELWNQLEEINPKTFFEMYQFWCQKLRK